MTDSPAPALLLASRSPRRSELLRQIGVAHTVQAVAVDERVRPNEAPADYVSRLALAKARAGVGQTAAAIVLGADTAVVVDSRILGKPANRDDALAMLALLSGRWHEVYSGIALAAAVTDSALSVSRVCFRTISASERAAYWATGEPADKAGAYAIQGLGAVFVTELAGSYSGVMGLPLFETHALLRRAGIRVL